MCNWVSEFHNVQSRMAGRSADQYFPAAVVSKRPLHTVQPGHCLRCGIPLSQQEMFPPGRAPRYMCNHCYELAMRAQLDQCLWCGGALPDHIIQKRIRQPRELKYAFHEGPCLEYHTLAAGVALGQYLNAHGSQNQLPSPVHVHQQRELHPPNHNNPFSLTRQFTPLHPLLDLSERNLSGGITRGLMEPIDKRWK